MPTAPPQRRDLSPPAIPSLPVVTRFAPSPTGYLHVGHAYSARYGFEAARSVGGRFLLRIEDIDRTRCRPEYEQALIEDLQFLGLRWDGDVRRQSDHMADYGALLDRLQVDGLVYPCFCTRADIDAEIAQAGGAPHDLPLPATAMGATAGPPTAQGAIYPGTCRRMTPDQVARRLDSGSGYALRLDAERALRRCRDQTGGPLTFRDCHAGVVPVSMDALGDVVLGRKEVRASYHLAVTHDDALQGVTLVTRGEDLFHATHVHRVLQTLFGWPEPEYAHHPLRRDAGGERLAKRRGSPTLRSLRQAGRTAAEIWALLDLPPIDAGGGDGY